MQRLWGRALVVLLFFYTSIVIASPLDQEWLALLRFNKFSSGFQSEADSAQFFLTPKGKYSPEAEYWAMQKAMGTPVLDEDHALCRFPARALKIWSDGQSKQQPNFSNCHKLNQYLRATNAKAASLVFAGYFIQRPSSAFGHTFLRLHTNQQGNAALLDFAVDFAASVDTSNPIAYGVKGIVGGFPGRFSRLPYFLKLREYADLESRDIWEYPLNLSKEQTLKLVLHLWEMDQAYFNYFYFSENCSYHILRAIEAINGKEISRELKFFVTPLDTIHALNDVQLLAQPKRRASQHAILTASLNSLSHDDLKLAHEFLRDPLAFNKDLPSHAALLDTFIEILNYRFAEELLTDRPRKEVASLREEILLKRTKAGAYQAPTITAMTNPTAGHRSSWAQVGYFSNSKSRGLLLEHAFALHAFNHPVTGFSERFQMIMGLSRFKISNETLRLDRFDIFDVLSASPSFSWDFKPSWNIALGFERSFYDEADHLSAYALMSSGISFNFAQDLLLSVNMEARPRHDRSVGEKVRLPLGGSILFQWGNDRVRFGGRASFYREVIKSQNEFLISPYARLKLKTDLDLEIKSDLWRGHSSYVGNITVFY